MRPENKVLHIILSILNSMPSGMLWCTHSKTMYDFYKYGMFGI